MRLPTVLVIAAVSFALGSATVLTLTSQFFSPTAVEEGGQIREGRGVLTNPLLECDVAAGAIDAPKARFEKALTVEVGVMNGREGVADISVYYRDLNNGPAFGVNQHTAFLPASLLKVPLMMAFYKHAESDPLILDKKVTYNKATEVVLASPTILPEKKLTDGKEYSVSELLQRMIAYSDNSAMELLYPLIPEIEYSNLYAGLGIEGIDSANPASSLTVVEYSTFFRVLFNASYLSQASSEKALQTLTESTFTKGLRAGVPSQIQIAHKFGERDLGDGLFQLHDCGIVYVPKKPYLLCIMTRGNNQKALQAAIQDISKFAYEQVTQN
jgi:beta-lactamase class A